MTLRCFSAPDFPSTTDKSLKNWLPAVRKVLDGERHNHASRAALGVGANIAPRVRPWAIWNDALRNHRSRRGRPGREGGPAECEEQRRVHANGRQTSDQTLNAYSFFPFTNIWHPRRDNSPRGPRASPAVASPPPPCASAPQGGPELPPALTRHTGAAATCTRRARAQRPRGRGSTKSCTRGPNPGPG